MELRIKKRVLRLVESEGVSDTLQIRKDFYLKNEEEKIYGIDPDSASEGIKRITWYGGGSGI